MTAAGWIQIAVYCALLVALTPVLGRYLARVYGGERVALATVLGPVERGVYRLLGVRADDDMPWRAYARAALWFTATSLAAVYLVMRTQSVHPLNHTDLTSPTWDLSFNTAISFVTNTNWQFYGGETTMTQVTQMTGLAVQNFTSAAVGIAVAVAVVRGLARRGGGTGLGSFWADLVRSVLYVLLPLAIVAAVALMGLGVVQSLGGPTTIRTLAGADQLITVGPVASQEAIKLLGTNGGGYFNVNSAMPFENPTAFANLLEMLLILVIPAALTAMYGTMVGSRRQGWAIFGAMFAMFVVAVVVVYAAEAQSSPAMQAAGLHGANLEGKDVRFGTGSSALFAAITTVASCGAVNAAMDSLTGLGGAVPLANMMTGEVIFGGVGSGLYGMLMYVVLAVFLAGLMVGRTPELLGKKIEAREVKLVAIGTLAVPLLVLVCTGIAVAVKWGDPSVYNAGPQGFAESLYAYVSQANNNGSAFAGFTGYLQPDGTNEGAFAITFANLLGGAAMLFGRFLPMLVVLAVGGALAGKRVTPAGPGTMRTDTATFAALLIATIVLVALLTFVPALLLGPIVQSLTDQLF
ncbi:potassium-transporting ATPase subunit KdpA [Paraconexibacter algicola]|uniref:Potassium-transporting ATPase potassium-binding subunit n=1 Tax=Paraconexibacter algicola TaxID=2133960 RepID=A0A2T4UMI6_9ACTN|nr:potassium-transporting ATPase subunit KdpA [Paraconexibacter algicola]PTL60429.1 potassium-transporting ATPase subunit KdpA [Paraconexibacter algicola]